MAGGKRYKFQGSAIRFGCTYGVTTTPGTITGATAANPIVITETGHGRADGDVVKIAAVVGMTELNDGVFVIENVTANTYELADVDGTDYTTYVSGGTASGADLSKLCELTSYTRSGGTSPDIPATSQCSTAQEFEIGLPDFGTTQADYNFAPTVGVQAALQAAYASGTAIVVDVVLPNSGGHMVHLGFVQQTSEQASVNGLWTGSLTIRNTGPRYDFA